jgi:pimeloyl-ACP methyl ester carboxylesterase
MGRMALGTRKMTKIERENYQGPFKERNSRNRPLRLFHSFLDLTTQRALDDSLPAFRDKPALIQFGEKDPMTAQGWPERWAQEIPNHRVRIIPRVKHFTFEDQPETTVEEFLDWWAEMKPMMGM